MTLQRAARPVLGVAEAVENAARLNTIDRYEILDTPPEPQFDRIARLVCNVFGLPMGVVSIIDAHRQWYKASAGMKVREAYAPDTICRHTLVDGQTIIVPNAMDDPRFAMSPLVQGEPHIRFCASTPMRASDGNLIGTVCGLDNKPRAFSERETQIFEDIAQIAMDAIEMRRIAGTDVLTGAMTRRAFLEVADKAMLRAKRHRQDLVCIMLDIDHFKKINDTFGHQAGDEVLRAVSLICRTSIREVDHFCRVGGEEFVLLLEQSDPRAAYIVAEKLRLAIAATPIIIGSQPINVTASFGATQTSTTGYSLDVLMAAADAHLYEAKKAGRNCTRTGAVSHDDLRHRVVKAGRISYEGLAKPIDCTVTSLSGNSASVEVVSTAGLPDMFKLTIASDGIEANTRVGGKTGKHLDLDFVP